jgi:hypothetical protein
MIHSLPCETLNTTLGRLFVCLEHGEFYRIRTPFLYPDGDNIDLFCKQQGEEITVTDLGETVRWLRMQTLSPRRSQKQQALVEDTCETHGVEFYRGMVLARAHSTEEFAAVVTRVAQAALRVSDLWFTFRTRAIQSVTDDIADFLSERVMPFERGERLLGRSGRGWTVDFHVRTPKRSSLVFVLATGSRSAARGIAEHVVAAWYDLNQLTVGPESLRFVSLFDDTVDVWAPEDFKMVEPLSAVVRWSSPEEFLGELQPAA